MSSDLSTLDNLSITSNSNDIFKLSNNKEKTKWIVIFFIIRVILFFHIGIMEYLVFFYKKLLFSG